MSAVQRTCIDCGTTSTPVWRTSIDGRVCNCCGLRRSRAGQKPPPRSRTRAKKEHAKKMKIQKPKASPTDYADEISSPEDLDETQQHLNWLMGVDDLSTSILQDLDVPFSGGFEFSIPESPPQTSELSPTASLGNEEGPDTMEDATAPVVMSLSGPAPRDTPDTSESAEDSDATSSARLAQQEGLSWASEGSQQGQAVGPSHHKALERWSREDVLNWLQSIGLGHYQGLFRSMAVSGPRLVSMQRNPAQLALLGMSSQDITLVQSSLVAQTYFLSPYSTPQPSFAYSAYPSFSTLGLARPLFPNQVTW